MDSIKEGDKFKVLCDKGKGHPAGTVVVVEMIGKHNDELYCKADEGNTTYWYKLDELERI